MSSISTGITRTLTPIIVGYVLGLPIAPQVIDWLGVSQGQAAAATAGAVTAVLGAAWYVLVRLAEKYRPWAGVLLGRAVQPQYAPPGQD